MKTALLFFSLLSAPILAQAPPPALNPATNSPAAATNAPVGALDAAATNIVPAAATNLLAARYSRSKVKLTWIDNATNEAGYYVLRSLDGVTWTQVAVLGANATSFIDSTCKRGKTYYYKVVAYNSAGQIASNVTSFTV